MEYINEIEKKRKAILVEAGVVLLIDLCFLILLFLYKEFDFLFVILVATLCLFMWQGLKHINDFFQKKVEDTLWLNDKKLFGGLKFDVDEGENVALLNKLSFVPFFQKKEGLNSLERDDFLLSEVHLYDEKKLLGLELKQTKLEGIILEVFDVLDDIKGEILSDGKDFGLAIENVSKREEIKKILVGLMAVFKAKKCVFEKFEEKLYIFFETDKKMLYQFLVCRRFDINLFVSRISILTTKIDSLIKSLKK